MTFESLTMRVLFTHSYFLKLDPKQYKLQQPYAPLGTLYAAAMAREGGHAVQLHDSMFAGGPEGIAPVITSFKPDVLVIYDDGFNYLTKMCLTNMREAAFGMCRMGEEYGCKVICSSSDSTDHSADYLHKGADVIITGEGERTLMELLQMTEKGADNYSEINGIVYRDKNGTVVKTPARKLMTDLDELPLPAWDLLDITPYKEAWTKKYGYFSINVATTRGCPFKCNWCAKPIYGNRYNIHSPEYVVNELKVLKEMFGFERVWFCDDIFGLKPGWVKKFAALVHEQGLQFRFKIQSRADLLLEDEQAEALADAGCEIVWMGAESGSQKILDAMDKGTTIRQVHDATMALRKRGVKSAYFIQFGYPGETMEDIGLTLKMIKENKPDDIGISVSYPLPGTKFYERVKAELTQKKNWTDSDDLEIMFRNTFDTAFAERKAVRV